MITSRRPLALLDTRQNVSLGIAYNHAQVPSAGKPARQRGNGWIEVEFLSAVQVRPRHDGPRALRSLGVLQLALGRHGHRRRG